LSFSCSEVSEESSPFVEDKTLQYQASRPRAWPKKRYSGILRLLRSTPQGQNDMNGPATTRAMFTIAAVAFLSITAAATPLVTFEPACECR
jgi:hypothetical protein